MDGASGTGELLTRVWPLLLALPPAVADWIAVAKSSRNAEYILKPLTMVVLVGTLALSLPRAVDPRQAGFFLAGLLFSLLGDTFLMLRSEHLKPSPRRPDPFLAGLVSFLLGHLAYIIGLMPSLPPPASYPLVLLVTVVAVPVMRPILRSLARRGERNLAPAVAGYGVVLALMFVAAAATLFRETWSLPRSLAAALGGLLFFVSDSILAWNRFVRPVPAGSVLVHATYHPAQVLLAMSVVIP